MGHDVTVAAGSGRPHLGLIVRELALLVGVAGAMPAMAAETQPAEMTPGAARLKVWVERKSPHPIPRFITGKFTEHLGSNIYNGISAQILRNPTFADYPFWRGSQTPDGRPHLHGEERAIGEEIRRQAARLRWPEPELARLVESRADALAHWWVKVGPRDAVRTSPDAGPFGGRAQRVEVAAGGQGIAQWTHLPLHRTRAYQFELHLRSPDLKSLTLTLAAAEEDRPVAEAVVQGVSGKWAVLRGNLRVAETARPDAVYRLALVAAGKGQLVIERMLLWPADHIGGADPDVVRLLKESRLPLMRWPGGNFVSGYHWEDGVGPMVHRPTRPNWAWGGLEPNLFGTDEFVALCRAIGCEPMICINAADGTPDEAARWVEYCNGPATSPMGAKRAANGHPEPYNIRLWEVGNELWGKWQVHWTTPRGNVDRFREFSKALLQADPSIELYACGAPVLWGREWNQTLIDEAGDLLQRTTDHPLIGGDVPVSTEPLDVYRSFMAVPDVLEQKWAELRDTMLKRGIKDPKLAITELQLFAHLGPRNGGGPAKLTQANLVTPGTQAEALYDVLIYHTSVRLSPFVDMVTQSATVNHGGGLRKEFERVYPNPCHHAQAAFAAFQGATPVAIELQSPRDSGRMVLPDVKGTTADAQVEVVAALAAVAQDGALLISVVHRGTGGPVKLAVELDGFRPAAEAEVWTLSAETPWAANTLTAPETVKPSTRQVRVSAGSLAVEVPPYSVLRVRVPRG